MAKEKETVDTNNQEVIDITPNVTTAPAHIMQEEHSGAVAIFDVGAANYWSSFVANTPQEKAELMNALQNPTYKLDEVVEKNILMTRDVVAHKVQLIDQKTGESIDADRVVLILEDGQTVAGVSKGFKGGVTNLMNIFGKPTWNDPLPLFLTRIKTRGGNLTYNLSVLYNSPLPQIGKKF